MAPLRSKAWAPMRRPPIRRASFKVIQRNLAYIDAELARDDLPEERRRVLTEKRPFIARELEGRCKLCGREIHADESIATGIGSTCRHTAAS